MEKRKKGYFKRKVNSLVIAYTNVKAHRRRVYKNVEKNRPEVSPRPWAG